MWISFSCIQFLTTKCLLQSVFASYKERAVHFMELPGEIPNRQVFDYLGLILRMKEITMCNSALCTYNVYRLSVSYISI